MKNNFRDYADDDNFISNLPARYSKVINAQLTSDTAQPPEDALTPQEIVAGRSHDAPLMKLDHRISVAIDEAMEANFTYE